VNEILSSYKQQRNEYDKSSQALEQRTRDLETEIARQRDHVTTLKRQAAQIDGD
jgi:polyhydroxyalkanoate synthesis regulator phasin